MQERDTQSFWQQDLAIGETSIRGAPLTLRLKLHQAQERYHGNDDLLALRHKTGQLVYFRARPYTIQPDIALPIVTYSQSSPDGAVREVVGTEWEGVRHVEVGSAQAW